MRRRMMAPATVATITPESISLTQSPTRAIRNKYSTFSAILSPEGATGEIEWTVYIYGCQREPRLYASYIITNTTAKQFTTSRVYITTEIDVGDITKTVKFTAYISGSDLVIRLDNTADLDYLYPEELSRLTVEAKVKGTDIVVKTGYNVQAQ